ncbi:MAG: hypothetical protein ABGZ17_12350, partial [Planctomycetaceae bacterium]
RQPPGTHHIEPSPNRSYTPHSTVDAEPLMQTAVSVPLAGNATGVIKRSEQARLSAITADSDIVRPLIGPQN